MRAPRRGPSGRRDALRAWGSQHLQCAVASLGTLYRAPLQTLLTAAVIGVALALPLSFYLVIQGAADVSARFGESFTLSAFLRPDLPEAAAAELGAALDARNDVAGVRLIARDEALAEFQAAAGLIAGLESFGGENPLPAVLVVAPASRADARVTRLAEALSRMPEVEFVQVDRDWLLRLGAMLEVATRGLWLLAALLAAGVMLVVGNTLRLSIEGRRSEVEIAKLFGASDGFVRRPFLYHGLLYGLAGALVACSLSLGAGLILRAPLRALGEQYAGGPGLADLMVPGPAHLGALLLCGGLLGLAGAWLSVGFHLRDVEPR